MFFKYHNISIEEEANPLQDTRKTEQKDEHQQSEVNKEGHVLHEQVCLEDKERNKKEEEDRFDHPLVSSISENKSQHISNTLVDDASLSSNDSYNAQTNDNCSEEASCLATDFGNFNNDELDIELFYECRNFQWRRMKFLLQRRMHGMKNK